MIAFTNHNTAQNVRSGVCLQAFRWTGDEKSAIGCCKRRIMGRPGKAEALLDEVPAYPARPQKLAQQDREVWSCGLQGDMGGLRGLQLIVVGVMRSVGPAPTGYPLWLVGRLL